MLHQNVLKGNRFRTLNTAELDLVCGGYDDLNNGGVYGDQDYANPQAEYFRHTGIWIDNAVIAENLLASSGGMGFDTGGNPDAVNHGCPANMTCTPIEGYNDMYVRGEDGLTYFSEKGIDRAVTGADTNWWDVTADLMIIVGGSVAGVGAGVLGILMGMIGMTGKSMNDLGDPTRQP